MKKTVGKNQFLEAFRVMGRQNQFTRPALEALFDALEQMEQDTGQEMEMDVIGLCCDFTEYGSPQEAVAEYGEDIQDRDTAIEWLNERTWVIEIEDKYGVFIYVF